ncbi:MAG TPA: DUF429 domain-containing protein [Frankiaceae bacterium]|nr:DUF429 domain-containing protein [Frankiaceae bacterium]
MRIVAGVDGCPRGWVAAVWGPGGVEWRVTPLSFAALLDALGDAEVVAADVPIGLAPSGHRACDVAARERLAAAGASRSSVFLMPPRPVLEAPSHADACRVGTDLGGKGISVQTWYVKDRVLDATDHADARTYEAHPELSFLRLAGAALPPKKTAAGLGARIAVLGPALAAGSTPVDVAALLATAPRPARADDALDALACAWTARRILDGTAEHLGDAVARIAV